MSTWLAWSSQSKQVNRPTINFAGVWKNELGSEMDLTVSGTQLTGKYSTGVGSPPQTEKFDLVGFVNGDLIGFVVSWGDYGSMSSWVGQHTLGEDGKEKIITLWHLADNIDEANEKKNLWASILTGPNTFSR